MDQIHEFSFERLKAWMIARDLVGLVYRLTKRFLRDELFGMTCQSRRASVSVSANIAKGTYRQSGKDRNHFFEIRFGSLMELLNLMILSFDLNYLVGQELAEIRSKTQETSLVITGLSKSTQNRK